MALKALMLRRSIDIKKSELEQLLTRGAALADRERELEQAISEANTPEEEATVAQMVEEFDTQRATYNQKESDLRGKIAALEQELADEEAIVPPPAAPRDTEERKDEHTMSVRNKFFGMDIQERTAFFADQGVKDFLGQVRTCIREKRALTNAGLLIPTVALGLLRQVAYEHSKLASRVSRRSVPGTGRINIMGAIPEAVWTEACASLNELNLVFNNAEVDGYKVGGFIAVCNAILEDSDINLMTELISAIGQAIGKALDKAIVYGTGVKMPLGIVTRLAQEAKPGTYPATARDWVDLHTTNIVTGTGATGLKLFQEIVTASSVVSNVYSNSGLLWMMNEVTRTKLVAQSMEKNMNAALVAGIGGTMPAIGGDIEVLNFIPDDNIVFGHMDLYLLAERAGANLSQSEHARFLEDQTVFKGTARYDGLPMIAEAFGVLTISAAAPTTSVTFPQDTANAGA